MYDFTKYKDIKELITEGLNLPKTPVVKQPKWNIPEEFVLKVAPVGAFVMREDNPNQPYTIEEISSQIIESLEAGACSFHTHIRNEQGKHSLEISRYHKLIDPIKKKYGQNVLVCGCPEGGRTIEESMLPVVEFKGIMEVAPITCTAVWLGDTLLAISGECARAHAKIMQDVGCKPEIVVHDSGDVDNVRRWLIETKMLEKPYYWRVALGNPGWSTVFDPQSMMEILLFVTNRIKTLDKESVIMVDMAGRCGLYMCMQAVLMGLMGVRVGMEDAIYLYPHKDEKMNRSSQAVKAVVKVVEAAGRKVGTADDYRKFVGIK